MDLSKFSEALSPANLGETCDITISPKFTIRVIHQSMSNQAYTAKLATFSQKFPEHQVAKDPKAFSFDWALQKYTPHTVSFMAHVILAGWTLTDNDGESQEFNAQNAIQLLNTKVGKTIFGKLVRACQDETTFRVDWTEDAIKNS